MSPIQDLPPEIPPSQFVETTGAPALLWTFPLFSFAIMALNVYLIVHALRTGRPYYWVWIIFAMPIIGALAYFLVEMRPSMGRINWKRLQWQFASPSTRATVLGDMVKNSPTVSNRCRLATELEQQGRYPEAVAQYRECLVGVFADDARLRVRLADALLNQGSVSEAASVLSLVPVQQDSRLEDERKLITYRCQSADGEHDLAIDGISKIAAKGKSLAALYYLAQAKHVAGLHEEAIEETDSIILAYRNGNALFRRAEREWFQRAKDLKRKASLGPRRAEATA